MKKSSLSNILVLTPGDPAGIGPEITWKAIQKRFKKSLPILCVGARDPFVRLKAPIVEFDPQGPIPKRKRPFIWLLPAPEKAPDGRFLAGYQAGWSIETATKRVLEGKAAALVTGPISKERLQKGGYLYPGHTEFLAQLSGSANVTMMLANSDLRVTLVTTHVALHRVSEVLTREKIRKTVLHTAQGLIKFWKIKKPRIAVTALNPHAGEAGLFGREEIDIITPEIAAIQKDFPAIDVSGPYPADTLFAKNALSPKKDRFDAVVCMYHDQGLVPVKLLDFQNTVNVTLGLSLIRTSVDHGVAFDIAGRGVADPSSLQAALDLATQFIKNRQKA